MKTSVPTTCSAEGVRTGMVPAVQLARSAEESSLSEERRPHIGVRGVGGVGLCHCGCGQQTTRTKHDAKARALKAGDFSRYVHGHWHRARRAIIPTWGRQVARQRELDELRRKLLSGDDVTQHFTTRAGLSAFVNNTRRIAPLISLYDFFPAIVRPERETYEQFLQRRQANDEVRRERRQRRILEALARTERQQAREQLRAIELAQIEARRDEREYRRFMVELAKASKEEARARLKEWEEKRRAKAINERELKRAARCFQWDDSLVVSMESGEGYFHRSLASAVLTPLEELLAKEDEEEREAEQRFQRYARKIATGVVFSCFRLGVDATARVGGGGGGFENAETRSRAGCGEGQVLREGEREARRNVGDERADGATRESQH